MDRKKALWMLNQVKTYLNAPSRLEVLEAYAEGAEIEFQAEPGETWDKIDNPGFYWDFVNYRVVPDKVYYNRYYTFDGDIVYEKEICFKTEKEASDYGQARLHVIDTTYESFTTHKKAKNK